MSSDIEEYTHPSSSLFSLQTPPQVTYTNLPASTSHPLTKAKSLRQQPGAIVDCSHVLSKVFGHAGYKGKQRLIMEAAVRGEDVFVLAPTGMGKSLCFQVPAVADKHGVTIVVSPLLALMKNQVAKMHEISVPAVSLTSETSQKEKEAIIKDLQSGHPRCRLLYITPETLLSSLMLSILDKVYEHREINRLVVDEAHSISEWGHDFRPGYGKLGLFRDRYKTVPIMALTATATAAVQEDIIRSLRMSEEHLTKFTHPFNRANLYYEVRYLSVPDPVSQMRDICEYIQMLHQRRNRPSSGIIYCRQRATCDEMSGFLRRHGLNSRPYHKGIRPAELDKTLKEWGDEEGGVDVVCATICFGMGIDKSDVRYVIHYDLPKSLEGYYQETGRSGRDGSPAKCILYYSREDLIRVRGLLQSTANAQRTRLVMPKDKNALPPSKHAAKSLTALANFAESATICRHVSICRYFGEPIDEKNEELVKKYCNAMCDICKYPEKTQRRRKKLSSEEFASTQVQADRMIHYDDESAAPSRANSITRLQTARDNLPANKVVPRPFQPLINNGRGRSLGTTKRANSSSDRDDRVVKKPRLPPALKTKPFASATGLSKPFKVQVPFSTPNLTTTATTTAETRPSLEQRKFIASDEVLEILSSDEEMDQGPTISAEHISPSPSPPMRESFVLTDPIDAGQSQKIPEATRILGLNKIRKAFHNTFFSSRGDIAWTHVPNAPLDEEPRNNILTSVTRILEHTCFLHTRTAAGYEEKIEFDVCDTIKMLGKLDDGGDEFEDAREIASRMETMCAKAKAKGKQRLV